MKVAKDILSPQLGEAGPDDFSVRSFNGCICIQGATPAATAFAVDWFLQKYGGVRWYSPGPLGEVVPLRREWTIPNLDIVRRPAYLSREIGGLVSTDEAEWARRNGLCGRFEFKHALSILFPPETAVQHPGWMPELLNRQGPFLSGDRDWQPNLALFPVAESAGERAAAAFVKDPTRPSFSLAINDTVRFDQGLATRRLVEPILYFRGMPDYSPLVFTFMNRAAASLNGVAAGHYLGCLAYFWCENTPPFPVDSRVLPFVASDRSQYYDCGFRASDLALMSRWGASGARAFGLWDYAYGDGFLVPRLPLVALSDAVREGWQRGARGYFADTGPQWGFDSFKAWMLAQLLWDPQRTFADLADDFYLGYYGPAAPTMRQFFQSCERQWMAQNGPPVWIKFYRQEDQALLFPSNKCSELRALLREAARAAETDPVIAKRVELTSRAFAVTEAFVAFDRDRRILAALDPSKLPDRSWEATAAQLIGRFASERKGLATASQRANSGFPPSMAQTDFRALERNDPVPRLLWLCSFDDPLAPRRLLTASGPEALAWQPWRDLVDGLTNGKLRLSPNIAANSRFNADSGSVQEPRFLYPRSGPLPTGWQVHAMPTEFGRVALLPKNPGVLKIIHAWDTQLYQWIAADAGAVYLVTCQLRGLSSPGSDSSLFLTFLNRSGQAVGYRFMQSLPKGVTETWRDQALGGRAPPDAAWIGLGVAASKQVDGDWLEIRSLELRHSTERAVYEADF